MKLRETIVREAIKELIKRGDIEHTEQDGKVYIIRSIRTIRDYIREVHDIFLNTWQIGYAIRKLGGKKRHLRLRAYGGKSKATFELRRIEMVVFYDGMDNDGKCAGAIASHALKDKNPTMVGLNRDMKNSDKDWWEFIEEHDEIYFLDLAPRSKNDLLKLKNKKVIIIDHHELKFNPLVVNIDRRYNVEYIYRKGVSATLLTWIYFYPREEPHEIVVLVNDRDIWANNYQPFTNYFFNVGELLDIDKFKYMLFEDKQEKLYSALLDTGKELELLKQRRIAEAKKKSTIVAMKGYNIAFYNSEAKGIASELGNQLCKEYGETVHFFMHVYFDHKENIYKYGLRSLNGEALKFIRNNNLKGGGHDNACGFSHPKDFFGMMREVEKCQL